jgi:N-formylglutamate amidohydrolase
MPMKERAAIEMELNPPYYVLQPTQQTSPFVFCSPHSGRLYPSHFLAQSRLDPKALRKSEDCLVDALFSGVAALGAPLLSANFPRAYLDVNREPFELDPELFHEALPDFANSQSVRVVGGLGTIARIVADGEEIYASRMSLAAGLERISRLYHPFHAALAGLLEETRRRFGYAILIDCHSMPSAGMPGVSGPRPDFVIGDRFSASCDSRLSRLLRDSLVALGYDVLLNRPYAGGYITEHYGRPGRGVHAVQLEINRSLYLDENRLTPNSGFEGLKSDLEHLAERLFADMPVLLERRAAE